MHVKGFTVPRLYKVKNKKNVLVSKLLIWCQKWVAGVRNGNLFVVRRASSGRIIIVLFWAEYAVPRLIKPEILKLNIRKGQSNLSIVLFLLAANKKTIIVSFRWDMSVLTAARIASAAAVCKVVESFWINWTLNLYST